MYMLLPLIILIILGCIFAGSLKHPSQRLSVVVGILIIILIMCFVQMQTGKNEGFNGYAPLDYNMRNGGPNGISGCGGYDYAAINKNLSPLSSYDGIKLTGHTATRPLISDPMIFNNVGDGYILKDAMNSDMYPTVDGQPGSAKSMFILKNNQVGPQCCPSIYSSDLGCVCMSPEQNKMFGGRGGNLTSPQEYPGI